MNYQPFFDTIEPVVLQDELARFLGVNDDGIIEISYLDIVKTAGHSCGTVAGAYLSALLGLKALFGEEISLSVERSRWSLNVQSPKRMRVW